MKITFVLPTLDMGGGIRVASIYARRLHEMGHDVFAVSLPPRPLPMRQRLAQLLKFVGAPPPRPRSHFDTGDFDLRVLDRWRPVTDADVPDADVVIATWWETAEWVSRLSPSKGVKVHFVQGHEVFDWLPVDRCKAVYRLPMRKIVVAQWLKSLMNSEYGNVDVELIPNSVDHGQFFAPPRGKSDRPTIGFLYSTAALKGIDVTLNAIELIRSRRKDLRVVAFGQHAPPRDELRGIEFHASPAQSLLRDLYARCDVWVTASRSEGFNLPAMEAMACRTPVVSTRTGWPEEAIVDGVNGWCVDVDDVDALARAVENVLALSDEDWRAMSSRAFDTVKDSSWSASAELFEHSLIKACQDQAAAVPSKFL